MDLAQALIFYVEWVFFTAWGMVLAAVSVIAFGRDILPIAQPLRKSTLGMGTELDRTLKD